MYRCIPYFFIILYRREHVPTIFNEYAKIVPFTLYPTIQMGTTKVKMCYKALCQYCIRILIIILLTKDHQLLSDSITNRQNLWIFILILENCIFYLQTTRSTIIWFQTHKRENNEECPSINVLTNCNPFSCQRAIDFTSIYPVFMCTYA